MNTMAVSSHGTLLRIGDAASPDGFTTVSEVMDISGPGMTRGTGYVTSADGEIVVLPQGREVDEITFEINYTGAATHVMLRDATGAEMATDFQIVIPTDPVELVTFGGYVTEFRYLAPVEGVMRVSVRIALATEIVFS